MEISAIAAAWLTVRQVPLLRKPRNGRENSPTSLIFSARLPYRLDVLPGKAPNTRSAYSGTLRPRQPTATSGRVSAARRGATLTLLIEEGLQLVLPRPKRPSDRPFVTPPECRAGGGTVPGVDLNDSAALLDRMEGRL